jgi:hypothetical protein
MILCGAWGEKRQAPFNTNLILHFCVLNYDRGMSMGNIIVTFRKFTFGAFVLAQVLAPGLVWGQEPETPNDATSIKAKIETTTNEANSIAEVCKNHTYFSKSAEVNDKFTKFLKNNALLQANKAEKSKSAGDNKNVQIKLENDKASASIATDLNTATITSASTNTQLLATNAKADFQTCSQEARASLSNVKKMQNYLKQLVIDFNNCGTTGTTGCTKPITGNSQSADMAIVKNQASLCQQAITNLDNNKFSPVVQDLDALIAQCDKDAGAGDLTFADGAILGGVVGAIVGGVVVSNIKKDKNKGDKPNPEPAAPAPGPGNGNTTTGGSGGGSFPGGSEGCPQGQAKDFSGQCVAVQSVSVGSGGAPEPSTTLQSPGIINIDPNNTDGTLGSGAGENRGAQGRNLSATEQPGSADSAGPGAGGELRSATELGPDGKPISTLSPGGELSPGGNSPSTAKGPGAVTSQTALTKFKVRFPKERKVYYLTLAECIRAARGKNLGPGVREPKQFCEAQRSQNSRNLATQKREKVKDLLK